MLTRDGIVPEYSPPAVVTIRVRIEDPVMMGEGEYRSLHYSIGREQAMEMALEQPPTPKDIWAYAEWQRRAERAEALSKAIATDLSHRIIQALNQPIRKGKR